MFKIREESSDEVLKECAQLGQVYYDEVEYKTKEFQYDLSVEAVKAMVDGGFLKIITVRDELETLVGFSAIFMLPEFTHGQLVAKSLFLYLKPHVRGGRLFYKLMNFIGEYVEEKGAKILIVGFKKGKGDQLLQRLGFTHEESIFFKTIGE